MSQQITAKDEKSLERSEDFQNRREQHILQIKKFKEEISKKRESCFRELVRYQFFKQDADELEAWIYEKLNAVSSEKGLVNLQERMKKRQAFQAEIAAHSKLIELLDLEVLDMTAQHHFASNSIRKKLEKLQSLWVVLQCKLADKGFRIQQAGLHKNDVDLEALHKFTRNACNIESWIAEKLQLIKEIRYNDDNVQSKYQLLEAEVAEKTTRVKALLMMGRNLIYNEQCTGREEAVQRRLDSVAAQWKRLNQKTGETAIKLEGRAYAAVVKELDSAIGRIERQLREQDISNKTKMEFVEDHVYALKERVNCMNDLADCLIESGQFEAAGIQQMRRSLKERFGRITLLNSCCTPHQFFRTYTSEDFWTQKELLQFDVADVESWLKEKQTVENILDEEGWTREKKPLEEIADNKFWMKEKKKLLADIADMESWIREKKQLLVDIADVENWIKKETSSVDIAQEESQKNGKKEDCGGEVAGEQKLEKKYEKLWSDQVVPQAGKMLVDVSKLGESHLQLLSQAWHELSPQFDELVRLIASIEIAANNIKSKCN